MNSTMLRSCGSFNQIQYAVGTTRMILRMIVKIAIIRENFIVSQNLGSVNTREYDRKDRTPFLARSEKSKVEISGIRK